jgi:hypothetical protein
MKKLSITLRNFLMTLSVKYRDVTLFFLGVYFFFKGLVESQPGIQLPQSRFIEQFGEKLEMIYAVTAILMGLWLMVQHRFIKRSWWFRLTHIVIFVGFLFQIWVVFVAATSEPPFGILATAAIPVGILLGTIYVLMGVEDGTK